ncbi:MAG: hypothetical protein VB023_06395 [Oscillibacter sp.]|nr:hypothetical protein [Oscillibacter sp.]
MAETTICRFSAKKADNVEKENEWDYDKSKTNGQEKNTFPTAAGRA